MKPGNRSWPVISGVETVLIPALGAHNVRRTMRGLSIAVSFSIREAFFMRNPHTETPV